MNRSIGIYTMKKKGLLLNVIAVMFSQLIPQRETKVKDATGKETGEIKITPARTVEVSFSESTTKEVNAANLAQFFLSKLVAWQRLRPLQGAQGFQTSKLMTVGIKVNNKELATEMKFTVNPERIEKCLERSENLVALIAQAASAPKFGAPKAQVSAYLLATPTNVIIAKERKELAPAPQEEVPAELELA